MNSITRKIFVTGATGYIGSRLIVELSKRNYVVRALVRRKNLNIGCETVLGNPLSNETYKSAVDGFDTFIHLVGVSHPNPAKKEQFHSVDYVSIRESVKAALSAAINHFIYISVAHPAPIMKDYIMIRKECEQMIIESGLNATILRPWYVLGPGHRWPYLLIPFYKILEKLPSTKETAQRLGLVTINQLIAAMCQVIVNPAERIRIISVNEIKNPGF